MKNGVGEPKESVSSERISLTDVNDMFTIWIVYMVSWVNIYVKTYQILCFICYFTLIKVKNSMLSVHLLQIVYKQENRFLLSH